MMLQAVLMVCALNSTDCTPSTALQVVNGPVSGSARLCAFQAGVMLAQNPAAQGMLVKAGCLPVAQVSMATDVQTPMLSVDATEQQASN